MKYGKSIPAIPTTQFERDALRYLKYNFIDECGVVDVNNLPAFLYVEYEKHGFIHNNWCSTPSNVAIIMMAYRMAKKYRKIARLRKKFDYELSPIGFYSFQDYEAYYTELD